MKGIGSYIAAAAVASIVMIGCTVNPSPEVVSTPGTTVVHDHTSTPNINITPPSSSHSETNTTTTVPSPDGSSASQTSTTTTTGG
jgi:hypothetical protein